MPTPLEIEVTLLVVNPENYRFEAVESQVAAIEMMVEDQTDKLLKIAASILKIGTNPNDWPMVTIYKHDTSQYLVLEGNRRITALKILNNIDLLSDQSHSALKNKFKNLLKENTNKIPNKIWCNVYDDSSEADIWIKLKHSGANEGVGVVGWTNQAVLRYQQKIEGKSAAPLQVLDLLHSSEFVDQELKDQLKNLNTSTLERIIGDKDVKVMLGISTNNGELFTDLEEAEVVKGLSQIARDVLTPGFTVNNVYTKEDRKDYISNFPATHLPNKTKTLPNLQKIGRSSQTTNNNSTPKGKKPIPVSRNVLIPSSCKIAIVNPKVNSIYHELRNKKLAVDSFKNAVAVLFRVFVELSVDTYLETHNLTTGLTSSATHEPLQAKVLKVVGHMYQNNLADKNICKGITHAVKKDSDLLGLENWHAYVHNNKFSPDPTILTQTWDNVEPFFVILWNNIT